MSMEFIRCALIRAFKTFCQTIISLIGTAQVLGDIDWRMVCSASFLAAFLSLLTSVVTGLPEAKEDIK
ncbi:MAG: holin [Clostridium sp.]|nr:holin [Clostridium sp.]